MPMLMSGVPRRIVDDGWWLDDPPPAAGAGRQNRGQGVVLLGFLALADLFFWRQAGPGLSLALFLFLLGVWTLRRRTARALLLLALMLLPLVERVQPLSLGFAALALLGCLLHRRVAAGATVAQHVAIVGRLVLRAPVLSFSGGRTVWRGLAEGLRGGAFAHRPLRVLALPLGLGLIFAALLAEANPVLADWAARLLHPAQAITLGPRPVFWAGMALVLWPVLALAGEAGFEAPAWRIRPVPGPRLGLVTAGSVLSSLWLFNGLFAVQTGLDLTYLWGGADLPQGMTHAEYAHRGAYPLVVTALLAGVFALVSRPFAGENPVLRLLLLVWIGQNVALVLSALYRLDLYVGNYGLTYLRAYAAIWMGLVAAGLALTWVQVARGLANGWLVRWATGLGAGVLYLCAFVNFAGLIADYNLAAAREGRLTAGLDAGYICALGVDAWAAVQRNRVAGGTLDCNFGDDLPIWGRPSLRRPEIADWRDWSYRSWRLLREGRNAYSGRG